MWGYLAGLSVMNLYQSHKTRVVLVLLVLLSLSSQTSLAWSQSNPIEHIVILYQENRTFDHFFGTYPGANGLPLNVALPKTPGSNGTITPFHLSRTSTPDLDHSNRAAKVAYNNGKMDGFIYAENSELTMGYYDYRELPYYWDYASKFVLMDNFYSSQLGPSLPNHLYLIAGQSGGIIDNPGPCQSRGICQGQSSKNPYGLPNDLIFNFGNVMDQLDSRGISWKYYTGDKGSYKDSGYWNPLPAFASFKKNPQQSNNLAPNDQFLVDLANGNLANVVWVIPKEDESDHPSADVKVGEKYLVTLLNAIMQSRFWSSTAVFVTWDDYGGWYDHVPPPQVDEYGFGFRVPCLIISPYAKEGFVDHTQSEFASILKFIQTVYGLPSLTRRDAMASNMLEAFDFYQSPNPPLILPGPYIPDHYPLTMSDSASQAKDLLAEAEGTRSLVMASTFTSLKARGAISLGMREYNLARSAFAKNDFSSVIEHARNAINLFQIAYTVERESTILNYVILAIAIIIVASAIVYLARRKRTRKLT